MQLEASCHCGKVHFQALSHTPYPFMHCYCSICRKTAGGGGFGINIMAEADSLKVRGEAHIEIYQAELPLSEQPEQTAPSEARRHFCRHCGSPLWIADPRWAEWVYPFASAIDTPLPLPPERHHALLENKAPWVEVPVGPREFHFSGYPDDSLLSWHQRLGLYQA
ncbi:MAG: GFA family protein [Gammaproteobacteria bacterium]|nr:GFA family protein [Gammaproteobacteria bacterium]